MPHFADGSSAPSNGLTVRVKSSGASNATREEDRIRMKNRRLAYLERHPEYFSGANLELADPLLYDRLIRRFLTPAEREREGRERGYTGSLEADLVRSEAKLEALRNPDTHSPVAYRRAADGSITGVEADADERAGSREEGEQRWRDIMGQRFLKGEDKDFEYSTVDESEEYDDRGEEDRKQLDAYLDAEDEEYIGDGTPKGETGVQDF